MKEDKITITFKGPKKFQQALIDRIYEALMDEDFFIEATKPGCSYDLESTIEPSEEVMV